MRRFRGCQRSWHLELPHIYEGMIDESVNTCCKLKLIFGKAPERKSQTSRDPVNSRPLRTHEKNSGDAVRRLDTTIQSIFCAQSGANIRLTVWKWSGESRYPGAFPPVLENFRCAFSPARLTAP